MNGVHGLLKYLGWNFYLSFEVPPDKPKALDFSSINFEDVPLKEKRIVFNWHNFLSGCTGWDYEQWQQWIDNSSKSGFNTIMVHAYGNNPMQSFNFNGVEKEYGYLSTTQKGRDWGTQHVNDVRLLHGGDIYKSYEFGSKAAMVPDNERSPAATSLMKEVFRHASLKGMGVCYAIDVDTWMANPQNIIKTLPDEALIEILGYQTVNPDHPEGRKYYKAQLDQLFLNYPEIDILAAWMRNPRQGPGLGSTWLHHNSGTLPEEWQKEYFKKLTNHPELKDERPWPGLFAVSKIIKVYRELLDEINPQIELVLGSWGLEYPKLADLFIPEYCGFIPLDYSYTLSDPEVIKDLSEVGEHRNLYPVVWAHHDDYRYIGRPYIPYTNFNSLLDKINSRGYGIIHWTTHPLDLLFSNYENQVWKNTENESLEKASEKFVRSMLKREDRKLIEYYLEWFTNAPMFGRETSDSFIPSDEDYQLEGYKSSLEVVEKAEQRLLILRDVNVKALNEQGKKEYNYQVGMEKFIISFFTNHNNKFQAYNLLQDNKGDEALTFIQKTNPYETLNLYAETITEYSPTRGEEGLLISLNLRWLPDYIDLKQRAGLEPVFINFQPTSHDPLAQGAGKNTFFIDELKNFWLSLGEKELGTSAETSGYLPLKKVDDSWINISEEISIPLRTIRNHDLPVSDYDLTLYFAPKSTGCKVSILENGEEISSIIVKDETTEVKTKIHTQGGKVFLHVLPENGNVVKLAGCALSPL